MNGAAVERPVFFEGQFLGAADLTALVRYFQVQSARHALGLHTWGVVVGLELAERTSPEGQLEIVLTPGLAFDGYGRQIVVLQPTTLQTTLFTGLPQGEVEVWLRYASTEGQGVRKGFEVCSTDDEFARINESFAIEVGERRSILDRQGGITLNGETLNDAREALRAVAVDENASLICDASVPHQDFPADSDDPLWLVPLGFVHWLPASAGFQALSEDQRKRSRVARRHAGAVTEDILAANGVIRLRDRTTPFDETQTNDQLCAASSLSDEDLLVCDETLRFDDVIRLEANTRLTGHARIWGKRLEFRPESGDATPLLGLQQRAPNDKGGADLQVLLEQSDDGSNRLMISQVVGPADPCDPELDPAEQTDLVAIQDDGKVGIGTFNPTTTLESTLTIRGTGEQADLVAFEDTAGASQWRVALGENQAHLDFIEILATGDEHGRLFLEAGGDVGIGTTSPEAKLDVTGVQTTSGGSGLGNDLWFRVGNGEDEGRVWVEYGQQAAPLLVLSDDDEPPRIQFQQGSETAPAHQSWFGHGAGSSADLAIMGARLGIGTEEPTDALHIKGDDPDVFLDMNGTSPNTLAELRFGQDGTTHAKISWHLSSRKTFIYNQGDEALVVDHEKVGLGTNSPQARLHVAAGSDVTANGDTGMLILGDSSGASMGLDGNEIQARDGNSASTMWVQASGGAFRVGANRLAVEDDGQVGINTTNPECRLHVRDSIAGDANQESNHVACIENTSSDTNADVLALSVGQANPGTANNFITFFAAGNAIGRIERSGGVLRLESGGADVAECLPALDPAEDIRAGDVVGVHEGRISRRTAGAERVLVVTDTAMLVGNAAMDQQSAGKRHSVALMGQIGVNVSGAVRAGDLLLPSGRDDGTARAVPAPEIDAAELSQVIGQAWQSDPGTGERRITAAVSFLSGLAGASLAEHLAAQERRLKNLEARLDSMAARGG